MQRLVFLDESGAKTNMTRLYGRSFDGGRLVDATPHGHWCMTTMLSSIRADGTTAAMTIEGATDAEVFAAYVRQILVPTLRPGDIVVMDNLAPHKMPAITAALEAAGAEVRFLPPYSPDLNPHREDVVEGQGAVAQGEGPDRGNAAARDRQCPGRRHSVGRDELVRILWLHPSVKCSNSGVAVASVTVALGADGAGAGLGVFRRSMHATFFLVR